MNEIYKAALAEGGIVTAWMGGDESDQQDSLKSSFEAAYPGVILHVTVDLSKYIDSRIDFQLSQGNLIVDTVAIQTLQDFPRWVKEGASELYQPLGFDKVYEEFKDPEGAYYPFAAGRWQIIWNTGKLGKNTVLKDYTDFLKPEFKGKMVLTYPNDDDAVLYCFDLILKTYGASFLEDLIANEPKWVRGTATPTTLINDANSTYAMTFTAGIGLFSTANSSIKSTYPTSEFMTGVQTVAIFKDAPHPETAKLFHNYLLSKDYQSNPASWSFRRDIQAPSGYPRLITQNGTKSDCFHSIYE
ncbi:hypothetical protein N7462_005190 [Penicillium macrosclerotiorum]|uniref:uncharacterized protein n=1 Tax=Penicillium macrosclerotiorum TaxID=303699 RepID=UPI00254902DC|nr:uncharacterized protein N7462_005190 [Penicillium macrosclerotiorum]KAJ5690798.1 hypothetical protein N7462_005190 [Penicillium macrosclerotiorum]